MSSTLRPARPIDHLVLPTASLATARLRLAALGFSVAPEGVHPFGTRNACVYLADGTFLEPLAVGDYALRDHAACEGNVFVERDRRFRATFGEEGFSAVVLGTDDAEADHARFAAAGLSAGPLLSFSRPFIDSDGRSDEASFRLAFAAISASQPRFLFTCERLNAPKVDRSTLERHSNGVASLVGVTMVANDVVPVAEIVAKVARSTAAGHGSATVSISLANSRIDVLRYADFAERFGQTVPSDMSFAFALVAFGVKDLSATEALFTRNAIRYGIVDNALLVAPQPGQGAHFLFEEAR